MDTGLGMFADRRTPEQIEAEKQAQEKLRAEHEETLRVAHMVRRNIRGLIERRYLNADEYEACAKALMQIAMMESMCITGATTYSTGFGCV